MKKYIILLRGINVGGKNKISMKELKETLEKNGFNNVITFINSGNLIFYHDSSDLNDLKIKCEKLILAKFKLDITVLVLSSLELIEALRNAPKWWDADKDSKHNALFVIPPATVADVFEEIGATKPEYEKISNWGNVIFWSAPLSTFSRTRLSKVVGSSIYKYITIRNANTIKKLADLSK